MSDKERITLASMLFANTQIQIELIDELSNTSIYKQSIKNHYNKVQSINEDLINNFYKGLKDDGETVLHHLVRVSENFVKAIKDKDINVVDRFLKDYLSGELRIEEEPIN